MKHPLNWFLKHFESVLCIFQIFLNVCRKYTGNNGKALIFSIAVVFCKKIDSEIIIFFVIT